MRKQTHTTAAIAALILLMPLITRAQKLLPPEAPEAIHAPVDERVILLTHASGSQIYSCQAGVDNKFVWTLKAPDAQLKNDKGKVIGRHFAGPAWKLKDDSEVKGRAVAHADSPDQASIPWLLVNVVSHTGKGRLAKITTIQRVNTHGGKPPAEGCDDSRRDAETRSSYTADYYFYAKSK